MTSALLEYLKIKNEGIYHGKLLELREEVRGWLSYIPQTFPHFTKHTIEHSEQIILQMSHLLFEHNDVRRPVINLAPTEAYILCAAALLHDAGMVASDSEKLAILESPEWKAWIADTPLAAQRYESLNLLRSNTLISEGVRNFLADVELRRILADYIRRSHHDRSAKFAQLSQAALGRFGFDDEELISTVAALCRGHGLSRDQLDDDLEFPLLKQIRGENINVRLLAILLRLGDLLDLHSHRACPLLLAAATPVVTESLAHWSQYKAIKLRSFTAAQIRIDAECDTADQHRVLADWFDWIAEEVQAAPRLLAKSTLHAEWKPPTANIGSDIVVKPSLSAKYKPYEWKFDISLDDVLRRLSDDAYNDHKVFIRELIQNALDTSRCKIYFDNPNERLPKNPILLPAHILRRYPIKISLSSHTSSSGEVQQTLRISDLGMGMDAEAITRHFLQIGKSYYRTADFRRQFSFSPNSRFGIGFLSVFAVSDDIFVDTKSVKTGETGLVMRLTGPRNYIAVESSSRSSSGTEITVRLSPQAHFKPGELTRFISEYCIGSEIPIEVDDFGDCRLVSREMRPQVNWKVPDIKNPEAYYFWKNISHISDAGAIDISLLSYMHASEKDEWAIGSRYEMFADQNPQLDAPDVPTSRRMLSGIVISTDRNEDYVEDVDTRDDSISPTISRDEFREGRTISETLRDEKRAVWNGLIESHLKVERPFDGWAYRQRLIDSLPCDLEFAKTLSGTIAVRRRGKADVCSLNELYQAGNVTLLWQRGYGRRLDRPTKKNLKAIESDLVLSSDSCRRFERAVRHDIFNTMLPTECRGIDNKWFQIALRLKVGVPQDVFFDLPAPGYPAIRVVFCETDDPQAVRLVAFSSEYFWLLAPRNGKLFDVFTSIRELSKDRALAKHSKALFAQLSGVGYATSDEASIVEYCEKWNLISNIPPAARMPLETKWEY